MSAAPRSDLGAALAVRYATAAIARQLDDGEIDWPGVFEHAAWALVSEGERTGEDAGSLATTLVVAAVSAEGQVELAAVGDSPALRLPGGDYELLVGERAQDDGLVGGDFARLLDFSRKHLRRRSHADRRVGAMTAVAVAAGERPRAVRQEDLGELVPVSRAGGQGRVYRPQFTPAALGPGPVVVKLYRRAPPSGAAHMLGEMVAFGRSLGSDQRAWLHAISAWPLAVVHAGAPAAGIVMRDVTGRFAVPFVVPSGRRERVLLTLEHLTTRMGAAVRA